MRYIRLILFVTGLSTFFLYCNDNLPELDSSTSDDKLFISIPPSQSGIEFQNKLVETESWNYYKYMYSYIGGGVAAADFNNDGLEDLFFVSNTFDNQLYLNLGDFKFEEVGKEAGIEKREGFDAGATVVDINNDGFLDIYITRGGWIQENNAFANMLYINDGIQPDGKSISFTEKAEDYGLADNNRSIQATFFDYDKDGDLDVYISNTPDFEDRNAEILDLVQVRTDPKTIALKGSDKLYQNDGTGHFNDVSSQAGILPDIGFGLNPQVGDLNNDGWLDVYVCNDFRIPDFAYVNNGDGTFREGRNELFKHMSFNSMGSDIADIDNDGLLDLYTLDMNPEDYIRSKTTMGMTSVNRFEEMVSKDYHYQYMHNMLQLNNGNGTYREIANMAGVGNTDWSWAALLADFDLDGFNDIFVTNGVYRDVIDRDANNRILQGLRNNPRKPSDLDFLNFTKMLPQQKLTNYFFKNKGDFTFENVSYTWTDSIPNFSNGATYTDLDNDGDLDVVINNINDPATILKNTSSDKNRGAYLKVRFNGPDQNKMGIGTIVKLIVNDDEILVRQLINSRGFLSSVSNTLHFGLKNDAPAVMEILWPDGKNQRIENVQLNQLLVIDYVNAAETANENIPENKAAVFTQKISAYEHIDPPHNDYQKQILLPHKLSQTGPAVAKADVNGDGQTDVFLGGGFTQAAQLLIGQRSGGFRIKPIEAFERDKRREDVAACFFDADKDGDQDLYVASGSYEFEPNSKMLLDRLYINDGRGSFSKSNNLIPDIVSAGSVVIAADFDSDGDEDLFVGSRVIPGAYPFPPSNYLLTNENGQFNVATQQIAPELSQIGMVTDAVWNDLDNDKDLDLVVTGEWMGVEVFVNEGGQLSRSEQYQSLISAKGWWNKLLISDIDKDGDQDIIAGNLGLNSKFHASAEKPFHVYTKDFDYNGTVDVFLAKYYKDAEVPVRGKTCTAQQMPHLAQKIPTYTDFANQDLEDILGPGIKSALHLEVTEFRSGIFINEGGTFNFYPLPNRIQQSPINSILCEDFDQDGHDDLLLAGNNFMPEIETTRYDGGIGQYLEGTGEGKFDPMTHSESGFFANHDVRNMIKVGEIVLVINNNDQHQIFELNSPSSL